MLYFDKKAIYLWNKCKLSMKVLLMKRPISKHAKETVWLCLIYFKHSGSAQADISLAYETMTADWPDGLACEVVEKPIDI